MFRWTIACFALVAVGAAAGVALGTPPFLASGTPPVRGTLDEKQKVKSDLVEIKTKGSLDVVDQTVTIQPGGHSGWHGHSGPALVVVKSGTVTFYDADDPTCTPHTYSAGEALVDSGHGHIARNLGAVPVELSFTLLVPVGAPHRTDMADPGTC